MLEKKNNNSLSQKLYSVDQVRLHEETAANAVGIDMFSLMQRAGRCVYQQSLLLFPGADNYLVVVGAGLNAGDGYVTALNAYNAGKNVRLCAIYPNRELTGNVRRAQENWLLAGGTVEVLTQVELDNANIIIDGLLGTGLRGNVRSEFADAIKLINHSNKPIVSIDVPSGLDANTGVSLGECIQANATVTFVGIKLGVSTGAGKQLCGHLVFEDLGIGKAFVNIAQSDASTLHVNDFEKLRPRALHSHKGSYGKLLCIGGNQGMSGAIRLSAEAALRCGSGMVKVYTHESCVSQVCSGRPELMVSSTGLQESLQWATSIVIGPGLGQDLWSQQTFDEVMAYCKQHAKPIVIDADALNLVARSTSFVNVAQCVMTPHAGEAARLLNVTYQEIEANRFVFARRCAKRYSAVCVLKGAGSLVDDGYHCWVCSHGNPGMASAGMGDVLAGVLGALMAQGLSAEIASQYAVSIHAKAGDIVAQEFGQRGLLASDLFTSLRALINS